MKVLGVEKKTLVCAKEVVGLHARLNWPFFRKLVMQKHGCMAGWLSLWVGIP